jgi:hypothetical protein
MLSCVDAIKSSLMCSCVACGVISICSGSICALVAPPSQVSTAQRPTMCDCFVCVCVRARRMYGPDFLVSPVTTMNASSWSVYLPTLVNSTWTYYWNGTDVGAGGVTVSVNTTSIAEYPVFVRTPSALGFVHL